MTTERSGTGLALARTVRAPPLADERLWQAEPVEHTRDGMVHDVVNIFWSSVKGRHRRQDHRAHLRERDHALEVAEVERRLAHEQDQRAALLSVTSAARAMSESLWHEAIAPAVLIEQGAITMPAVRKEPDAIAAPMSLMS